MVMAIPIPFLPKIYKAIGQDPEIAALACQYGWTVFPGMYFHFQATANVSFANSMKQTIVSLWLLAGAGLVHVLIINLFVHNWGWGYDGLCYATALHFVVRFTISFVAINTLDALKNKYPDEVQFFSKETITNLGM